MKAAKPVINGLKLLKLLSLVVILGCYNVGATSHRLKALESKYDKKQEKGPVYHPLREKPYTKKTFKV